MIDIINGLFECAGGLFIALHCWQLYIQKDVKGVSMTAFAFFAIWGYWNLYYYPSLNQIASFVGGCLVVVMNTFWVIMAIYYVRKNNTKKGD